MARRGELKAFRGITLGLPLGALLWALLILGGCALSRTEIVLERAARMGLVRWEPERAAARINDGSPWSRERRVEISR